MIPTVSKPNCLWNSTLLWFSASITAIIVWSFCFVAIAINSANKVLKLAGVQLAQKSHTEYVVVSVEEKKARLTAQTNRFTAALARF